MNKHYFIAMLVILIGISAAASDKQGKEDYRFSLAGSNSDIVSSDDKVKVIIKDGSFQPSKVSIAAGGRVEWHNQDEMQHTVVSDDQNLLPLSSGLIMPGKKYSFTFNTPGVYGYHCSIQEGMQGKITVTAEARADKGSKKGSASPSWSELPLSQGQSAAKGALGSGSQIAERGIQMQIAEPDIPVSAVRRQAQTTASLYPGQTDLQKFSSYYSMESSEFDAQLTSPAKIEFDEVAPETIYFGSAQKALPYSQYQSYATSTGANSLWISGSSSWTQYAVIPIGSYLNIIATTARGGYGYLYEIYPDGKLDKSAYSFYPYTQLGFYAGKPGEHQLFFNIDGQPSNVIVIYVVPYQQIQPSYDSASITIRSNWLRGYSLYVDGSYAATEGTTGEEDGILTIDVPGDQSHNIAIDGDGMTFSDYKYFQSGYAYQLNI